MSQFGGSRKTAIAPASNSTKDTTQHIVTAMDESENYSLDQDKKSYCGRQKVMPFLLGENSTMIADSEASTAPSSAMRAPIGRVFLSPRLMQSLITAGLVKGITPTSTRKQSGQPIRVFAFNELAGANAEKPRGD